MNTRLRGEEGAVSGPVIANIVLLVLVIGFGSMMIWALVNYTDQKNNVDAKIDVAVATAKKEQSDEDEKKFAEREKEPYRPFVGPDDLGRVTFNYPKTYSVYVDKEGTSYEAYLHPSVVPPLSSKRPYALRVSIVDRPYEQSLKEYDAIVKRGELKSTPVTINGYDGNRLDGRFSKEVEGSMVVFKVRDKTLRVFTEAATFRNDFNDIILKSLNFNA